MKDGKNLEREDWIPCEMFLEQTGFFSPSSKRLNQLFEKNRKVVRPVAPDKEPVETTISIRALERFGLPVTFDQDLYRAFLKICDETAGPYGILPKPMYVSSKRLLKYAGKSHSVRERKGVTEWFQIMQGTQIKGMIYRHKEKAFESKVCSVFDLVEMRGDILNDGTLAKHNTVWVADWWKENYEHGHTRRFNLEFYNSLRKPIAKALLTVLETAWYASKGNPFKKLYTKLCEDFLLTQFQYLAKIKQQLGPAHDELKSRKFLKSWEILQKGSDFVVSYTPGERFERDQKARLQRKRQYSKKSLAQRQDLHDQEMMHNLSQSNTLSDESIRVRRHEITERVRKLTEDKSIDS